MPMLELIYPAALPEEAPLFKRGDDGPDCRRYTVARAERNAAALSEYIGGTTVYLVERPRLKGAGEPHGSYFRPLYYRGCVTVNGLRAGDRILSITK